MFKYFFVIIFFILLPSFVFAGEELENSNGYRIQFDNDLLARGGKFKVFFRLTKYLLKKRRDYARFLRK